MKSSGRDEKLRVQIPEKLVFLFDPARYKVARGGRGSGKSWSFARALLVLGVSRKIRVLCAREVQLSIKQSVHKLLKDQIELLGLSSFYRVLETEIRGTNGTEFAFYGLSSLTIDTIKSFEGIDYCWVEEGQTITKRSWDILIPTIRKEGSEIWISYNPDLESDETHQRFTVNPPPGTVSVEINWKDNPWFSGTLDIERRHCQTYDQDNYDNIWEGKCRPAVEGAIYFKQIQAMEEDHRICDVPCDPLLAVHVVVDLGWNDQMAIGLVQKNASSIRVIDYIEDRHKTLAEYDQILRALGYRWGRLWLPHDGFSKDIKTGMSSEQILSRLGWDVAGPEEIVQMGIEEGIKATRQLFSRLYIDRTKCARLIECLKRYRRAINRATNTPSAPLHDEFSNGADMLRYVACNVEQMDAGRPEDPVAALLKKIAAAKPSNPLERSRSKLFSQPPAADIPPIPRGGLRV